MSQTASLCHFNVPGSKWGVRRYQNYDGSYTPLGRIHYGIGTDEKKRRRLKNSTDDLTTDELNQATERLRAEKNYEEALTYYNKAKSENSFRGRINLYVRDVAKRVADKVVTEAATAIGRKVVDNLFATNVQNTQKPKNEPKPEQKPKNEPKPENRAQQPNSEIDWSDDAAILVGDSEYKKRADRFIRGFSHLDVLSVKG